MNIESRRRRADDHLVAVAAGTDQIDDPHLVVVTDTSGGGPTYFGPYPDATTALGDALALRRELRAGELGSSVTTVVARIYAPVPHVAPGPSGPRPIVAADVPVGSSRA